MKVVGKMILPGKRTIIGPPPVEYSMQFDITANEAFSGKIFFIIANNEISDISISGAASVSIEDHSAYTYFVNAVLPDSGIYTVLIKWYGYPEIIRFNGYYFHNVIISNYAGNAAFNIIQLRNWDESFISMIFYGYGRSLEIIDINQATVNHILSLLTDPEIMPNLNILTLTGNGVPTPSIKAAFIAARPGVTLICDLEPNNPPEGALQFENSDNYLQFEDSEEYLVFEEII